MTKQEAYEKIRAHFTRPGAKLDAIVRDTEDPELNSTLCVYRGNNDPKSEVRCSFGVLIPDELYRPEMERNSAHSVLKDFPAVRMTLAFSVQLGELFLSQVQELHDKLAQTYMGSEKPEAGAAAFVLQLDELASRHNLNVPTQTGPGALPATF